MHEAAAPLLESDLNISEKILQKHCHQAAPETLCDSGSNSFGDDCEGFIVFFSLVNMKLHSDKCYIIYSVFKMFQLTEQRWSEDFFMKTVQKMKVLVPL